MKSKSNYNLSSLKLLPTLMGGLWLYETLASWNSGLVEFCLKIGGYTGGCSIITRFLLNSLVSSVGYQVYDWLIALCETGTYHFHGAGNRLAMISYIFGYELISYRLGLPAHSAFAGLLIFLTFRLKNRFLKEPLSTKGLTLNHGLFLGGVLALVHHLLGFGPEIPIISITALLSGRAATSPYYRLSGVSFFTLAVVSYAIYHQLFHKILEKGQWLLKYICSSDSVAPSWEQANPYKIEYIVATLAFIISLLFCNPLVKSALQALIARIIWASADCFYTSLGIGISAFLGEISYLFLSLSLLVDFLANVWVITLFLLIGCWIDQKIGRKRIYKCSTFREALLVYLMELTIRAMVLAFLGAVLVYCNLTAFNGLNSYFLSWSEALSPLFTPLYAIKSIWAGTLPTGLDPYLLSIVVIVNSLFLAAIDIELVQIVLLEAPSSLSAQLYSILMDVRAVLRLTKAPVSIVSSRGAFLEGPGLVPIGSCGLYYLLISTRDSFHSRLYEWTRYY